MATRYSGKVAVEVRYVRRARMHRLSPPGAYQVVVMGANGEIVETLLVGVPARLKGQASSVDACTMIAQTALSYVLGDHPGLPVELHEDGMVRVSMKPGASEGDSLDDVV